jgi:uncharacterized membrane protein YkvA (DUF1232 family)
MLGATMAGEDETLESLQDLVNDFALDVGRVRAALADDATANEAKALLVGALNYVLDTWDMFPDHYPVLGLVDDALVLRVSAHLALQKGASHRGVQKLAGDLDVARELLGDLAEPFERLCATLPARPVRGRTAATILADADVRALFDADLTRLGKKDQPLKIEAPTQGSAALLSELRKMVKSALARAGIPTS